MMPLRALLPACLLLAGSLPVAAASFDCAKAATPFEHAVCDVPDLSRADEVLAKSFATALGGLTKASVAAMRADQRNWLDYAQRACTDDAEPPGTRAYDEKGAACLVEKLGARSKALEQSRMRDGHRFYIQGSYGALPDPDEAADPDSYWKVASHELVFPLLDGDDPLAGKFNAFVQAQADELAKGALDADTGEYSATANTATTLSVDELAGENRITLEQFTYWYGHGAAHGNWSTTYVHYLVPQDRALVAEDVFAGADWQQQLLAGAWGQLQAEHGEWLQIEDPEDIADIVTDPSRWSFSSDYGLVIQFQPYEVAAYAYGAPTVTVPWSVLEDHKADTQDSVRYGW